MDFGGIVLVLLMTPVLAAIGITTLAAFAIMTLLGLLTDMSFKRLFFVSFFMGLAAPILLAGALFSAFADGSWERDLRNGLDEVVALPEDQGGPPQSVRALIPRLQALRDDLDRGDLSEAEIERRIEELFVGAEGVNLDVRQSGAAKVAVSQKEALRVDVEGVQVRGDKKGLRITVD